MLKRNTVLVATVLMIGNVTLPLQALPLPSSYEESGTLHAETFQNRIADRLQKQGLETAAAHAKATKLFEGKAHCTEAQLTHLCSRLEGTLCMERLEALIGKRALFEQKLELTTAEGLYGIVLEATGKAPDEAVLQTLREVAVHNRSLESAV